MRFLILAMKLSSNATICAFFAIFFVFAGTTIAGATDANASGEKRIAFVVGNAAYKVGALPTPANDAGLIAQTLQAAGFDVVGARDLDQNDLRDAMRDFISKANASGPDTVVFVYLSGYGVQYQGDNYFAPVDAQIANATDVPVQAIRVSDFTKSLAAINNRGSMIVLDAARANPFVQTSQPLAGGLALVDPDANQLIGFNAAPGTVAPQEAGPYGSYAHALAEMIRVGGLPLDEVFDRTRLRVSDLTKGAQISWDTSNFKNAFSFFDRGPNAPAASISSAQSLANRTRPIRDFDERDAYFAALDRDTLEGYEDFLAAYPNDAMARRVRAIVGARREAITWRETWFADTPEAYWSYLRRYPRGPHMWDARRRLGHFEAALEPPLSFTVIEYEVPPPPPSEIVYVDRPVLYFDDVEFGYAPPPPVVFLAPPPPNFVVLAPPPPPIDLFLLPAPVFVPVPASVNPPHNITPPENNTIFNNIHNTVVNNTTVIDNGESGAAPLIPGPTTAQKLVGAAVVAGAGAAALHVALPPSVQRKAAALQKQNPAAAIKAPSATTTTVVPSAPLQSAPAAAHALPGTNDQSLPAVAKSPASARATQVKPAPATSNTIRNPTIATQAPQQGVDANAHALPSANGQSLPVPSKPPSPGNITAAKGATTTKENSVVASPKPSTDGQAAKPTASDEFTRAAAKPKGINNNHPRVSAAPPRHLDSSAAQPRPAPNSLNQAKASGSKPPSQPKVAQKVRNPQPQHKPVEAKKRCGALGLPACH